MYISRPANLFALLILSFAFFRGAEAQSTQFNYQGNLNTAGAAANGSFDFEFLLFDALNDGSQVGVTVTRNNIPVMNGIFSVQLDFATAFSGAARFMEIRVRPSGQPGITILTPRQRVDSAPYAIKSLNAEIASNASQLGGVEANQFVVTTDPRMTNARSPTAGSANYIQNSVSQQAASNFNISGNGTVAGTLAGGIVRANTQFNFGNTRVLSMAFGAANLYLGGNAGNDTMTGLANTFLGRGAGGNNTTGASNTFVGEAGGDNTTGSHNAFFGYAAGSANTTGSENSFFGRSAGHFNTTGINNSFFGYTAGYSNGSGNSNAFFGRRAGYDNTTGGANSFFGTHAGNSNTTGSNNAFYGAGAGASNTTGLNNSFFGTNAGASNTIALGNSFFGANAGAANVAQSNSFFGASAGLVNTTGVNNSFFGTVAGVANTTGFSNSFFGHWAGHENTTGDNNTFVGRSAGEFTTTGNGNTFIGQNSGIENTTGSNNTVIGTAANLTSGSLSFATAIGAGATVGASNTIVLGRNDSSDAVRIYGTLSLFTWIVPAASAELCLNVGGQVGVCGSSLRYKTDVRDFDGGLSVTRRLRPIAYRWKSDGAEDVGFAAEEVNEVDPRLVQFDKEGRVEGVRYGRITTVLVNAVNEQQTEMERLRRELDELRDLVREQQVELDERLTVKDEQQRQIDALTKLVCRANPQAEICREN